MRLTAFIGAALIGLCALAFSPVAMADPAPNIHVLDFSQPVDFGHALVTPAADFAALPADAIAMPAVVSTNGASGDAERPDSFMLPAHFDGASYRQHFDPGRMPA